MGKVSLMEYQDKEGNLDARLGYNSIMRKRAQDSTKQNPRLLLATQSLSHHVGPKNTETLKCY